MHARRLSAAAGLAMALAFAGIAQATPDVPINPEDIPFYDFEISSGLVRAERGDGRTVVWAREIHVPEAGWLRLRFEDVLLGGAPGSDDGAILRITSLHDGAMQHLNQVHIGQWQQTSAYFNGDTVLVEIIASHESGHNQVTVVGAWAGGEIAQPESICGGSDDRVLSFDNRAARYLPAGCTAWIFDDAFSCVGSAGHCVQSNGVIQFNVPLSSGATFGQINHPPPADQYAVDPESMQMENSGVGQDWAYFGVFPNSETGLRPYQAYGMRYQLSLEAPAAQPGRNIRITGYGSTSSPVDPTWYLAQKTHVGPYDLLSGTTIYHSADTTGGNSGSAILWEEENIVIGVHSHAGCGLSGVNPPANRGTAVNRTSWRQALDNPQGVCQGPPPPPKRPLFIGTNTQFRIGSVDMDTGRFIQSAEMGLNIRGMAFDRNSDLHFMASGVGPVLYAMHDKTLEVTQIGTIVGAPRIDSLAYDPITDTLYGTDMTSGQLFSIDTQTAAATPIGVGQGGSVAGLAFDANTGTLYGARDIFPNAFLIEYDTTDGSYTTIGSLGSGFWNIDGLAWCEDGDTLVGVNDFNNTVYEINRTTGAATAMTVAQTALGPTFGLSCSLPRCFADFTGSTDPEDPAYGRPDGVVDAEDFFYFLQMFAAQNRVIADLNGDGVVDADDFFLFLDLFKQGC